MLDGLFQARHDGHAGPDRQSAGGRLVTEQLEQLRAGSHERDAGLLARTRERRVLRQEPVARMNRVHVLLFGQGDDAIDVEIGLHRAHAAADLIRLVGLEAVETERVFLGIDRDGPKAQLGRGPHDANRDLTPVEREQFVHGRRSVDEQNVSKYHFELQAIGLGRRAARTAGFEVQATIARLHGVDREPGRARGLSPVTRSPQSSRSRNTPVAVPLRPVGSLTAPASGMEDACVSSLVW